MFYEFPSLIFFNEGFIMPHFLFYPLSLQFLTAFLAFGSGGRRNKPQQFTGKLGIHASAQPSLFILFTSLFLQKLIYISTYILA